jgi:hypothetical protein
MRRVFKEMWVLTYMGNFVKDKYGAYVMADAKQKALTLAEERGKDEVARKCRFLIEDIT